MRPYLAVLKDSFREALSSRVLYITLILIALFLLIIGPVGLNQGLPNQVTKTEITDTVGLMKEIQNDSDSEKPTPGKHIWGRLSDGLRERIPKYLKDPQESRDRFRIRGDFRNELNKQIATVEFYDPESWADVPMDDELRDTLNSKDRKGVEQVNIPNRNALESAYENFVTLQGDNAVYFSWGPFRIIDSPLSFSAKQRNKVVSEAINQILAVLMGMVGIFVSILVTASFIPRTFEPGEITLLLSKPVSRSFLFLTKFLGGCAFTLLNATFLMVGIWLIAGLRHGIWNHNLLWCIPVYVFIFSIYYCVSAGAGAIWQNAIISVVAVIIFWMGILGVGLIKGTVDQLVIEPDRISEIVPVGDELMVSTSSKELRQWNPKKENWQTAFAGDDSSAPAFLRRFGSVNNRFKPVYDKSNDRLVAIQPAFGPRRRGSNQIVVGDREDEWNRKRAGNTPTPVVRTEIDSRNRALLIGNSGIYHFKRKDEGAAKMQDFIKKVTRGTISINSGAANFPNLRPDDLKAWEADATFSFDRSTDRLAVYSDGVIQILKPETPATTNENAETADEKPNQPAILRNNKPVRYEIDVERELEKHKEDTGVIAIGGERVVIAFEDGNAAVYDSQSLEEIESINPLGDTPRLAETSPDGSRLAFLTHGKNVWVYNTQTDSVETSAPGQGDISAVAFDEMNSMLIANQIRRVQKLDGSGTVTNELSPRPSLMHRIHQFIITPIYTILPKPGELSNLVTWLTTDQDSVALDNERTTLQTERVELDLWTPIWSSALFLVVVLAATCFYIGRRDF